MASSLSAKNSDSHVDERATFELVRYANCWEDAELLLEALDVGPGDRVLSVASAGDNALALLSSGASVVAVDLSLPQLACLGLRVAAFKNLSYQELLRFLGVRPADDRLAVYRELRGELSPDHRAFWDTRREDIARGPIHAGKFERYFELFRTKVLSLIHPKARVNALLERRDRAGRQRFYDEVWSNRRWRFLFEIFFGRRVMGLLGRDPEFFRYVDGSVGREILRRTEYALTELPTHDNPYLHFILRGHFGDVLPVYLREERFEAIRDGIDRLTLVRGRIEQAALEDTSQGFAGFNLSDIFEYLDESTTVDMLDDLTETAAPQARLAYWNMMVPRHGHKLVPDKLRYLEPLSQELDRRDQAFFYGDFIVEETR
jgi:S-adenosylmethionine-diacylglycerol 3-amino-3-carboxypropyl transferase